MTLSHGGNLEEDTAVDRKELRLRATELDRLIRSCPGARVENKAWMLSNSFYIFWANSDQLQNFLSILQNPELAIELWDAERRTRLETALREIGRLLHNYVAASQSLYHWITESYRSTKLYKDKEVFARLDGLRTAPINKFIIALRNYFLHNDLPPIRINMSLHVDSILNSQVTINIAGLRADRRFDSDGALGRYLETLGQESNLNTIVSEHSDIVKDFYMWFGRKQAEFFASDLEELATYRREFSSVVEMLSVNSDSIG